MAFVFYWDEFFSTFEVKPIKLDYLALNTVLSLIYALPLFIAPPLIYLVQVV